MTSADSLIEPLTFNDKGLIPAITQDYSTGEIRMLAYMNEESLRKTIETGFAHYWSRSRQELWKKGETSGNTQRVKELKTDCDQDTILLLVEQTGDACHTGERNCFFNEWNNDQEEWQTTEPFPDHSLGGVLGEIAGIVDRRDRDRPDGSYTVSMLEGDDDKTPQDTVLEKIGEEATELILAAKNDDRSDLKQEISDTLYHLLVLLHQHEIDLDELAGELSRRLLD
ncbi:MAG: bifunctional phosphoribosyl-AMP cyclohydrolase/phosphoribosyl-ATP diphosphatase HisIE [bacterium]